MSKSIAIIPARGGSKRIPAKNIKNFLGKPIIAYSIESAINSGIFDTVMVSTDDKQIADIAKKYGAEVPFMRSPETSGDMAMTAPVLLEVLNEYKKLGQDFDFLCCIYATAPFITPERLKNGMELLKNSDADSVLPIVRYSFPPQRGLIKNNGYVKMIHPENYNSRSQDLETIYHDCGQFYCLRTESFLQEQKLYCQKTLPLELPESEVQDIDSLEDWRIAEIKFKMLKGQF